MSQDRLFSNGGLIYRYGSGVYGVWANEAIIDKLHKSNTGPRSNRPSNVRITGKRGKAPLEPRSESV